MSRADWYFDFISPFSYLQWCRLRTLRDRLPVAARPVLFAGLLAHWGHKGPAEIPAKRRFTYRHVQWLADRNGIVLRFPPAHPFNPLRALRLALALGAGEEAIDAIFRFIWEEGRDPNAAGQWSALQSRLGVSGDALIEAHDVKTGLRRNVEEAVARGVFGVPTLAIGGELFWGFDATEMALDYIENPARFSAGEYARLERLPVAAARRAS